MAAFEIHPAINACLNASSAVLLVAGYRAIRRGDRERHRKLQLAALTVSGIFLVSYVIRFLSTGAHKYPGSGIDKYIYLVILMGHMLLAVALVPLALRAVYLAVRGRFFEHKRIVQYTFPIWMTVSVSGVVVYLMLYHLAPVLP
jgi:putative membrane protein